MTNPAFSYCVENLECGDWVLSEYHGDEWVRYLGLRFSSNVDACRFMEVSRLSAAGRAQPDYVYEPYKLPDGRWVISEFYRGKLSAHLGMSMDTKEDVIRFLEYNGWPRRRQGGA